MGRLLIAFFGILFIQNWAWAIHSTPEDAAAVRRLIEKRPTPQKSLQLFFQDTSNPVQGVTIKLPVSPGTGQGTSGLCWTFVAFSMLETHDLLLDATNTDTFSKGAMQYWAWTDRYIRYIENGETNGLREGGTVIDAFNLILKYGLYNLSDVPKFVQGIWNEYTKTKKAVDRAKTITAKKKIAQSAVDKRFFMPPAKTHWKNQEIDPKALAKQVIGDTVYVSYWHSGTDVARWGGHADADARAGTKSWYLPNSVPFSIVIRKALELGYPIEVSIDRHSILIYGATYDGQGNATTYFTKDSQGAPFYEADPKILDPAIWQATTVRIDDFFPKQ